MSCTPCKEMPVMTRRVTLQKPNTGVAADAGNHVDLTDDDNWLTVATRKCIIKTRGGSESYRFAQVQAEVTHLIDMRSDSVTRQVGPTWRLDFEGRKFDIVAAYDVDESRRTVRIHAVEQV